MDLLIATIILAFLFDIVNGFHDAANSIATVVSTNVLKPKWAVLWAAFFNFFAVFVLAPKVADTIAKIVKVPPDDTNYIGVIFAGLVGAIVWNLFTWAKGLPSSSSHALIGGLSGAALVHGGWGVLNYDLITLTIIFIFLSPLLGYVGGFLIMLGNIWVFRKAHPQSIDQIFRKGQLMSAAFYSIGHGANDAQKTMGVIFALLVAGGVLHPNEPIDILNPRTNWIIFGCHLAMAFGTALGGWRIVKTMGSRITKLKPISGFSAETSGASALFLATWLGVPVSTTHTITAAILGVGSVNNPLSKIKWTLAAKIVWAWIFTLPMAGLVAALVFLLIF